MQRDGIYLTQKTQKTQKNGILFLCIVFTHTFNGMLDLAD